ncbi:MAG: hypothetical protein A4E54_00132 [Pelotomaculum sp. PtaB.Bin117]|nr:MAG: hypothetical protein A4E54_00132 [Pelotomaculum sp. PtaB.Bin117]
MYGVIHAGTVIVGVGKVAERADHLGRQVGLRRVKASPGGPGSYAPAVIVDSFQRVEVSKRLTLVNISEPACLAQGGQDKDIVVDIAAEPDLPRNGSVFLGYYRVSQNIYVGRGGVNGAENGKFLGQRHGVLRGGVCRHGISRGDRPVL